MKSCTGMRLSFLPIPAFLGLVLLLQQVVPPSVFYDPPWLLPLTNTLFVTVVDLLVAVLALRTYRATGQVHALLLGSGVLTFGVGAMVAGFARAVPETGANLNVTIYNTSALGGAVFHLAAALLLLTGWAPDSATHRKGVWAALGPTAFVGVVALASFHGLIPPLFVQGVGPTGLRQVVLGGAVILFTFAWLVFLGTYVRIRERFLYWYSCALALTAISLLAFFIQHSVGSPVGWAGRCAQYVGGAYFLLAIVTAMKDATARHASFGEVLAASFRPAELLAQLAHERDQAQRRAAELAASEERLRKVLDVETVGVMFWDLSTGRMTDANDTFLAMLGYSRAEVEAGELTWQRLTPPEYIEQSLAEISKFQRTGRVGPYEKEYFRKDGTRQWLIFAGSALGLNACVEFCVDISSRKQVEAALRASERRERERAGELATILDAVPTPVILVHDAAGTHMTGNRAAAELLRQPLDREVSLSAPPDARPRHFIALKDGRELRTEELPAQRAARGIPVHDFEFRLVFEDGTARDLLAYGTPLLDDTGQPRGAVHTLVDITARKEAEAALQQLNATLEQRIQERTADLQRLTGDLAVAEQRERQRLSTVLHDGLQQLLVGARLQTELLASTDAPSVEEGYQTVVALLNESIAASRSLSAELSPPVLQQAGLLPALQWLTRWMRDTHRFSVELTTAPEAEPDTEPVKFILFQAVRELLFNAVKHAGVPHATLDVTHRDGHIQIVVADHGAGFDPLQVGTSDAMGLGLASIRQRVQYLGGRFEIESAPGEGSRFTLSVPLQATRPPRGIPAVKAPPAPHTTPLAGRKLRLILADDHAIMRQSLARVLNAEPDLEVIGEAADGKLAVELATHLRPDVVLMDISMPVLDGIEATREIRAAHPNIQVVGLSMFEEHAQAQAMRQAGATRCVTKSSATEVLLAAIRSCAG